MKKILIILMFTIGVVLLFTNIKTYNNTNFINNKTNAIGTNGVLGYSFKEEVVDIAMSAMSTTLVTNSGTVYSAGSRMFGQIGIGGSQFSVELQKEYILANDNEENGFINANRNDKVIATSAGYQYKIVLTSSGLLYGFGDNAAGQLGPSTPRVTTPIKLVNGDEFVVGNVKSISSGYHHNVILTNDGVVYTNGSNQYSQLGNGLDNSNVPIKVASTTEFTNEKVKMIASGQFHSMILTDDGTVYTFGQNENGQLGNGSDVNSAVPIKVKDANGFVNGNVKMISAGRKHSMILTDDGTVYTFGLNENGQLGNGSYVNSNVPIKVKDANGFVNGNVEMISAGEEHNIILTRDGTVYTFGLNEYGQLGNGSYDNSAVPIKVKDANGFVNADLTNKVTLVKAGTNSYISAIKTESGDIYTFGRNDYAQLGLGDESNRNVPNKVNLDIFGYNTEGNALIHDNSVDEMKYSTDVEITGIYGNSQLEIKVENGTYVNVMDKYISDSGEDGGVNTFILGENNSNAQFRVAVGEEKRFILKIIPPTSPRAYVEKIIIVDKRPPRIEEIIAEGQFDACNIIKNTEYYCNRDISFMEEDLSGFYSAKKIVSGVESDITSDIRNGLVNKIETEKTEKQKIIYTLIDGAGNISTITVILDNYNPRVELK